MKPKIAIIFTPDGIDTITVLSTGTAVRMAGYRICSLLEEEITAFEQAVRRKLKVGKTCNGQDQNADISF